MKTFLLLVPMLMLSALVAAVVRSNGPAAESNEVTARRYAASFLTARGISGSPVEASFRSWSGKCSIGGLATDARGDKRSFVLIYRVDELWGVNWWALETAIVDARIVETDLD